jgi:CrcB protein
VTAITVGSQGWRTVGYRLAVRAAPSRPLVDAGLVALGGSLGSLARWGAGELLPGSWATLTVNLAGCLAIGLLVGLVEDTRPRLRLLVGVGFLGGFTTFSAFLLETSALSAGPGAAYAVATVIGCTLLAALGLHTGRSVR